MENILDYLERLFLSFTPESVIIMAVLAIIVLILSLCITMQNKQIKERCKTNNVLRNQLLVFEKRNINLTEDNENLKKHIELLQETSERQAAEYNELQKEFNALSDEYQKLLKSSQRIRNLKGQFEKTNTTEHIQNRNFQ